MNLDSFMQLEYIFETSWEVCNRVGGIYTVLSTRAASMQRAYRDKVIFFGPDLGSVSDVYFKESKSLLRGWRPSGVRVGRWQVPGRPIVVLVGWEHLLSAKDMIYSLMWERYGVESHAAYGDYDSSCLFAYAVGEIVESLYVYLGKPVSVMHCNEWQTCFALLYLKSHCPRIGTLFTTHATSVGRSIAGNGKPLYDYFLGYHGDQMAAELNIVSKHSAEKVAAGECDCFTTVSGLTARECAQLLGRCVDIVTPNGFEHAFVPRGKALGVARARARSALLSYIRGRGIVVKDDVWLVGISGRLEWKNKGIDVFLSAMARLGGMESWESVEKEVVAFVMVPYLDKEDYRVGNVQVAFIPTYLDGHDGVLDMCYYDLLVGLDVTVFPSYYEPWGYTPLESIAFGVPTITTSLSGFGCWCGEQGIVDIDGGVAVISRTDSNEDEVVCSIVAILRYYFGLSSARRLEISKLAVRLADRADWKHFYPYYQEGYALALGCAAMR